MNEIPLKVDCPACSGRGIVPSKETFVLAGRTHFRHRKCIACEGSGKQLKWIDLGDFANMLVAIQAEKQSA